MGKQQETEQERKNWNKQLFAHIRNIKRIKTPCIDDAKDVERACEEYLKQCEEDEVKPTIAGLSMALGVNRTILRKWISGEVSIQTADIIIEYYSVIEIFDETALKENKTNAVAGLFNMKNNFGYKDEVEVKHVEDRKPSMKEIEEKYRKRRDIVEAQPSGVIDYTQPQEPPKAEEPKKDSEIDIKDVDLSKGKRLDKEDFVDNDDDIPF